MNHQAISYHLRFCWLQMSYVERDKIVSIDGNSGSVVPSDSRSFGKALGDGSSSYKEEALPPLRSPSFPDMGEPRNTSFSSGRQSGENRNGDSRDFDNNASRDSLNVLKENHRATSDPFGITAHDMATFTALPESTASLAPSVPPQHYVSEIPEPRLPLLSNYSEDIRRLRNYMPHLKSVGTRGKAHDLAELECWDYGGTGSMRSMKLYSFQSNLRNSKQKFMKEVINEIPPDLALRLIAVNSLSLKLIHILGSCLRINPEFFEEHLLNSGWHGNYADPGSDSWNTRDLVKNYASIKWYRPIQRRTSRPNFHDTHDTQLDSSETPERWSEINPRNRYVWHYTTPLVNILRRPWEVKLGSGSFSAWEERATIYKTSIGACEVGRYFFHHHGL